MSTVAGDADEQTLISIGAGAIEQAGARAPKFLTAGAPGGTTEFMGHL